ncbi:GNAT family N-acetyltransferase [Salinisphaera aquimarina]|uniref:GNAT family N-acetyltransferase n=1 Tax=Salinisphaera aquimarina TaxID=2094031 RepID=A0ABV7ELB2_9GAMM
MNPPAAPLPVGPVAPRLRLRAVRASDYDRVYAWHVAAFKTHIEQIWNWNEDWQQRDFAALFAAVPPRIVIYEGTAVGYIQIQARANDLHLVNIALDEQVRGLGLGGRLIGMLQARAAANDQGVTLKVFKSNSRAEALYSRLGFLRCGQTAAHHRMQWLQSMIS